MIQQTSLDFKAVPFLSFDPVEETSFSGYIRFDDELTSPPEECVALLDRQENLLAFVTKESILNATEPLDIAREFIMSGKNDKPLYVIDNVAFLSAITELGVLN